MNGKDLILQWAQMADIEVPGEQPRHIFNDDYYNIMLPHEEPNNYWHTHIPMCHCDDFWRHYLDININMDTLSIVIAHSFYNEDKEVYCFETGALLFYDSLYDRDSIKRVVDKLKELKVTLGWNYFPPEYHKVVSPEEIQRAFKERKW